MPAFRIDLHVHTSEISGCARVSGTLIPGLYQSAGYQGIVITDHYFPDVFNQWEDRIPWHAQVDHFLKGYSAAKAAGDRIGMSVFLGVELRMDQDHHDYLLYGADRAFLVAHRELYRLPLGEMKKLAEENGALLIQAHPFRYGDDAARPEDVHGVEVYNGNITARERNQLALEFARAHGLAMVSGSDFHDLNNLGLGGMEFPQTLHDPQSLVRAIRSGSGRLLGQ